MSPEHSTQHNNNNWAANMTSNAGRFILKEHNTSSWISSSTFVEHFCLFCY